MRRVRVIPVLLLQNRKLVKTQKFSSPRYIGDPMNALRIFNEKEVDEVVVLDIGAGDRGPDFEFISTLVSECFMPLAYGGGIRSYEQAQKLFSSGVEKVVLGAAAFDTPEIITEISKNYGAQSSVVCMDVKKSFFSGKRVYSRHTKSHPGELPIDFARRMQSLGAGEIILQSVDLDGTLEGYDVPLLRQISEAVQVPVVALGGAGKFDDFNKAVRDGKASAVAAGSMFVFQGPHRAILISYPETAQLERLLH